MITSEKLKIYLKYKGDSDSLARIGRHDEKKLMTDSDWSLIDSLIQDINMSAKGMTSIDYSSDLNRRLNENCDNDETIAKIKHITFH